MDTGRKMTMDAGRVPIHQFVVDIPADRTSLFLSVLLDVRGHTTHQERWPGHVRFRFEVPKTGIDYIRRNISAKLQEPITIAPLHESARKGDWMQLVSGKRFWPFDPRVGDFDINDIAHCLGNLCRYAGHTQFFYSVAEHCVLLSYAVPPEYALAALLHDGSEAYCADIPKPIKRELADYQGVEDAIQQMLCDQFGIAYPFADAIHQADKAILANEAEYCLSECEVDWTEGWPLLTYYGTDRPLYIEGMLSIAATESYIDRYYQILAEMAK